jgi:hypothetical protein
MGERNETYREIAETLKGVLRPYTDRLDVARDAADDYYTQTTKPYDKRGPLMFGAVRTGKAYVSYHLMPLYVYEELKSTMSPALRKRMQGKSCFNFKAMPDAALLTELRTLTEAGFERFKAAGYV